MIRVADYISQALAAYGLRHVFMVTGGGAMHLNDAFGRCRELKVICCHHEQACAMAAESYFRLTNRLAAVNVTTGPGATNAITGVFGAYVDSMAMIVISGQVKWETLVCSTGLPLRQLGDQEVDIVRMAESVTKYAVIVQDAHSIRYHLERALHLATSGRPGPVWLDVPMNVQGAKIDPEALPSYSASEDATTFETLDLEATVREIVHRMNRAERPVIYAGTGIRLADQFGTFLELAGCLGVPVVTAWNSNDLLPDDHPAYAGRPGSLGNRAGNFTVQNADFLLVLGCRLNIRLVSYNWENFARHAFKVMVDVDAAELKKPTLKIDLPVHADLRDALPMFQRETAGWIPHHGPWLDWCRDRLPRYPVVLPEYWALPEKVNPYCFMDRLFAQLGEDEVIACGDGTACVTAFQTAVVRRGQRLFHNSGCASMGYDLPAAIGAAVARPELARIVCLAGDGSIMMNLQELQTIAGRRLPVKIFILNNSGYHSIRQTQANFFADNIIGCGTDSGLSFPDFGALAVAFGFPFKRCSRHSDLDETIAATLLAPGPAICEIVLCLEQAFAPKLSSRRLEDGRMITAPLEDMAPFLSKDELRASMLRPTPARVKSPMKLTRTVLITGGARGIGAAIASELRVRGCRIIAPSRGELDLAQSTSVQSFLTAHAALAIDILINNAGINVLSSIAEIDATIWQTMLQTNVTAGLRLIQWFAPGMVTRGWGRILNLSTILSLVAKERRAAYSMTKAALNALTRSAAVEFGSGGVLVNALAPGYVDTDLSRQNNSPEALAEITASIPLRRMAQPAELAKAAAFLVSEENTYLTGQTILVDGGFTCL